VAHEGMTDSRVSMGAQDASEVAGGPGVPGGAGEARKWTLTVPAPCEYINLNSRMHWAQKAKLTKAWRLCTRLTATAEALPTNLERVHIVAHIIKPTNRQYDAHNLLPTLKAAIDGLVDHGLIPDDTNKHLIGPDLRQGGVGKPAIILTITEESP